jgi:hydroxymethylpyrimidine/phosphomethylpyrimidine kinase
VETPGSPRGASVITALTAQNTQGVRAIYDTPAEFVAAQIDAVFSDLDVDAVKVGMLLRAATIEAVAGGIERHRMKNVVLAPVQIGLMEGDVAVRPAIDVLRRFLFHARR